MGITTDQFLDRLKRRITVPANQVLLTNENMLDMADSVLRERVVPSILSVNQNYFVYEHIEDVISEQTDYEIPERAVGRGLRDIKLQNATNLTHLNLIALEDAHLFGTAGLPVGFYFQGDKLVLVPKPLGSSYKLRMWYDMQHSTLIPVAESALVSSVSGNEVTCTSVPTNIEAGDLVDFVQGKQGNSILGMDKEIQSIAGNVISFSSSDDVPEKLKKGDYISLAGKTSVLQIPKESEPLLVLWTAERVLYAIGDFDGAQVLVNRAIDVEKYMHKVLTPRIQGASTKIVNRNGLLRNKGFNTRYRQRGGYYT